MQKVHTTDLKAEAIRAALAAVAAANGGYLDPAQVVEAAADPESVLHAEFEWDDDQAAAQYRLAQAGALIRRVKFTVVKQSAETKEITMKTTRAYQSRESARRGEVKGYEPVQEIMKDPEKREELIEQVLRELAAYRKRYADLLALSAVWSAIDEAMEELVPDAVPSRQGKVGRARRDAASNGA